MRRTLWKLGDTNKIVVLQLLKIFKKVDQESLEFQRRTQISCPKFCSACCQSADVRTTALEMLPVAVYLWDTDQAQFYFDKLSSSVDIKLCVFFQTNSSHSNIGSCSNYKLRPLICRLFGFFTSKDKNGKYVYGSCKVIKETYPEKYIAAKKLIDDGFHPSNMTDFTIPIISMATDLGKSMLPINQALLIALEKVGFYQQISGSR